MEKEKSKFLEYLKYRNKYENWAKILEFFIQGRELEFCVNDIQAETLIHKSSISRWMKWSIKNEYLFKFKKGNTIFYRLNNELPIVKYYTDLFDALLKVSVNEEIKKYKANRRKIWLISAKVLYWITLYWIITIIIILLVNRVK